jgi:hypothetical protein
MARQQLSIQRRELSGDPVTRDASNLAFETYRVSYAVYKNEFKKAGRTWRKKRLLITELLGMGRHQVATNPKDAVFGMYGILQKLDSTIPPPDYSKSVEDIYIEAAKLAIVHDNSLQILLEISESQDLPELPSWVPDWNIILHNGLNPWIQGPPLQHATNKWGPPDKTIFLDKNMSLSVLGCFVDRVTRCSKFYIPTSYDREDFPEFYYAKPRFGIEWQDLAATKVLREWIDIARHHPSYPTGQSTNEVFPPVLVNLSSSPKKTFLEFVASGYEPWLQLITSASESHSLTSEGLQLSEADRSTAAARSRKDQESTDTAHTVTSKREMGREEYEAIFWRIFREKEAYAFGNAARQCSMRTRLFVTSTGYMGKGLKEVKEGDFVVLISGVSRPLIARKEGASYRLKGPCHVEGIMNGEKWPENKDDLVDITLR